MLSFIKEFTKEFGPVALGISGYNYFFPAAETAAVVTEQACRELPLVDMGKCFGTTALTGISSGLSTVSDCVKEFAPVAIDAAMDVAKENPFTAAGAVVATGIVATQKGRNVVRSAASTVAGTPAAIKNGVCYVGSAIAGTPAAAIKNGVGYVGSAIANAPAAIKSKFWSQAPAAAAPAAPAAPAVKLKSELADLTLANEASFHQTRLDYFNSITDVNVITELNKLSKYQFSVFFNANLTDVLFTRLFANKDSQGKVEYIQNDVATLPVNRPGMKK